MIPATAPSVSSVTPQAGSTSIKLRASSIMPMAGALAAAPCAAAASTGSVVPETASSGSSASIGITAMSWVNRTEKAERPPAVCIRLFSVRVCSTIAVDESDKARPMASATLQLSPTSMPAPITAAGGLKIGGVATQAPAISAFADTAAAQAGSSSAVVMNPATTADALATDSLVIGNRTSAATALATMEVLVKLTGGGLRRLLLSAVKTLVNTPDYALTAGTIPAGAGILTATHGLGAEPAQVEWLFRCGTADQGYSVGDTIEPATSDTSDNQQTLTIGKNATQAFIVVPATITIRHKSTFAQASMTKASWTAEVRCWL